MAPKQPAPLFLIVSSEWPKNPVNVEYICDLTPSDILSPDGVIIPRKACSVVSLKQLSTHYRLFIVTGELYIHLAVAWWNQLQ